MSTKRLSDYKLSTVLTTARSMLYGATRRKTIAVEGPSDVRFFKQWFSENNKVRFVSLDGKDNIYSLYDKYKRTSLSSSKAMFFCVDLDWYLIHSIPLPEKEHFLCNSYCLNTGKYYYNDLESFLVNTIALNKVLISYDVNIDDFNFFKQKLEAATRAIGKIRAADEITVRKQKLRSSIFNGCNMENYFDAKNVIFNEDLLMQDMPSWSNYPLYVDDLIEEANSLNIRFKTPWSLSRGHDITNFLSLYVNEVTFIKTNPKRVENELRLACEYDDFKRTPMHSKLLAESLL